MATDLNIGSDARRQLEPLLVERFGLVPPMQYSHAPGARSNRSTHLVVDDPHGLRCSLKYVSGHYSDPATRQKLLPTENIVAAAELSRLLAAPYPIEAVMFGPVPGLGPLTGLRFAVQKWHGKSIRDCGPSIERHRDRFLRQYGEWVAFGLLFALGDGKPEHWTWDEATRTLGRCDLELLFFEHGKVSDFIDPLRRTGALDLIRARTDPDFFSFSSGVLDMVEKFHTRRAQVDAFLATVDDHARAFLKSHGWALLRGDEFLSTILSELPRNAT